MCDSAGGQTVQDGCTMGRRGLLGTVVAGGAVIGSQMIGPTASAAPASARRPGVYPRRGLSVVLLGTQAGPPPVADRAGISSVVEVDGVTYVVDCGRSSVTQYQRAGLEYAAIEGLFLTHLHADHVADYYNYFMLAGHGQDVIQTSTNVYGPGSAGELPSVAGGGTLPVINPSDPVPGTRAMTEHLQAAFAYSSNVYRRESPATARDIRTLMNVHELHVPDVGSSPTGPTAPQMEPFVVMEDDRVKVSAILVPHGNVYPSFGFRFDTEHGSVTFSGDTRQSENVIRLGRGSDLLVHEAMRLPDSGMPAQFREAMLADHTLVDQVGGVAARADVPHLTLSHLVDFTGPLHRPQWRRLASRGYDGDVTVGEDLMRLHFKRHGRGIQVHRHA